LPYYHSLMLSYFPTRRSSDLDFFKNYLMMDMVDSDNIRKSVDIKPFESFAEVIRLVDSEGEEVPIRYLDEFDIDSRGGRDLDKRSEEHTSELQSRFDIVCRLL